LNNEYKLTERQFDFDYEADKARQSVCRLVATTSSSASASAEHRHHHQRPRAANTAELMGGNHRAAKKISFNE